MAEPKKKDEGKEGTKKGTTPGKPETKEVEMT